MERGRMNKEDEERLQSNILYLKANINPDDIIDHLLQDHVITFDHHGDLKSEKTGSDKMDMLIKILRFAGTNSYRKFVNCLNKSGYSHVAKQLLPGMQVILIVTFVKKKHQKKGRKHIN